MNRRTLMSVLTIESPLKVNQMMPSDRKVSGPVHLLKIMDLAHRLDPVPHPWFSRKGWVWKILSIGYMPRSPLRLSMTAGLSFLSLCLNWFICFLYFFSYLLIFFPIKKVKYKESTHFSFSYPCWKYWCFCLRTFQNHKTTCYQSIYLLNASP